MAIKLSAHGHTDLAQFCFRSARCLPTRTLMIPLFPRLRTSTRLIALGTRLRQESGPASTPSKVHEYNCYVSFVCSLFHSFMIGLGCLVVLHCTQMGLTAINCSPFFPCYRVELRIWIGFIFATSDVTLCTKHSANMWRLHITKNHEGGVFS